ncbi:MAG: hypothetical protein WBH31_02575 [Promethearchaeia archaeon]
MPSESRPQEDSDQKNLRISVKLDEFDHRVISKMAKNRDTSLSETMRNIVHQWIEGNPNLLKENYGVEIKEINEEIFIDTAELSYDKALKPIEIELIRELPEFFEMVELVSIEDLAEHFDVPVKSIKKIFFTHAKEIKSVGLNLIIREGKIFKE